MHVSRNRSRNLRATTHNHQLPIHTQKKGEAMSEDTRKAGSMRQAMPEAAALMDEVRVMFGKAWADQALREGMRLQREHARRIAEHGARQADAWLDRQRTVGPVLTLRQDGNDVGLMPGRAPLPLVDAALRPSARAAQRQGVQA